MLDRDDEGDARIAAAKGFRLVRFLGAGASSRVHAALDLRSPPAERPVALKLLVSDDRDLRVRFVREGRVATALRHPHLVGALEAIDDPRHPLLVLELVGASSLEALVTARALGGPGGLLSIAEAARHVAEIGAALAFAHERGLVHRDVKPANVLESEPLKLCDLGLARSLEPATALTGTGAWVGSLEYLAPEYARSEPIAAPADVYSLGATVFYGLTGRPPHPARNLIDLARRLIHEEPTAVARLRPDAPRGLSRLLEQLLAKDPEDRPTALEAVALAKALPAGGP